MYMLILSVVCLVSNRHYTVVRSFNEYEQVYSVVHMLSKDNIMDKFDKCYVSYAEWKEREE